jgi:hypothetical protein
MQFRTTTAITGAALALLMGLGTVHEAPAAAGPAPILDAGPAPGRL